MSEHPVVIFQEREGCTYKALKDVLPRLEKLGFKQILVHKSVTGFVPNTVYICTEPSANFPPITEEKVALSVVIPIHLSYVQCEYYPLSAATKDVGVLQFETYTGEIIGFFNKSDNILSVSDVTHPPDGRSAKSLEQFVTVLEMYKELGLKEFLGWVSEWMKDIQFPDFLMGADPEFEVVDAEGVRISACTIWPSAGTRSNKMLGHDGQAWLGEMRPNPKTDPLELTKEFKRLIFKMAKDPGFLPDNQMWVGGGMFSHIAGHIHISGVDPTDALLDALGRYIAQPMLRSQNIDGGSGRVKQPRASWKKNENSDRIRPSDDGDPDHWEWRPLMAYHIDEETTNAIHCLFYCVVETYRRDRKRLKTDRVKKGDYADLLFYDKYKEHIDNFVDKFVAGVQKMEGNDALDRWIGPNRPKDKKICFVCLHDSPEGNRSGGAIYDGIVLPEIAKILDDLRSRSFPNLKKSLRCNVTHYRGGGIRYAGVSKKGAQIIKRAIHDKMTGCDYSSDIVKDHYDGRNWDFCFLLPEHSYESVANRKTICDMIYEAIRVTLEGTKHDKDN